MLVQGPPLNSIFRVSHNGQLPHAPSLHSFHVCKDTWHHVFPSAVMTAPSIVFMAAGLWRLNDQGRVWLSIRTAGRSLPCLPKAAFTLLTLLWYHTYSPAVSDLQQNPQGGRKRRTKRAAVWGQRAKRGAMWGKQNERKRWRQRESEGMRSSPSLCLAALWLKRRVPGEWGGSRPAQSVLSLPWSPCVSPTVTYRQTFRKASFYCTHPPLPPPSAPKNLQRKHRLSWNELLSI